MKDKCPFCKLPNLGYIGKSILFHVVTGYGIIDTNNKPVSNKAYYSCERCKKKWYEEETIKVKIIEKTD